MIVYYSMMVWVLLMGGVFRRHTEPDCLTGEPVIRSTRAQMLLTMLYIIFFIGLRSAGADTHAYIASFKATKTGLRRALACVLDGLGTSKSPGFDAVEILFKTCISKSYHAWLFFLALVSGLAVAATLRRHSDHFAEVMLLFMLTGFYGWMINGVRQFVAVSLSFCLVDQLVQKHWKRYFLLILLISTIHMTALVMLPAYFVVQGKAWNRRTLLMMLGSLAAVLAIDQFTDILDSALAWTPYGGALEGYTDDDGSNILRTAIYAVPAVLAFVNRRSFEQQATPLMNVCLNFSLMATACSLIANFTSGIMIGRLPVFFSIYTLILLPWLVHNTCGRSERLMDAAMLICYFVYYLVDGGGGYYYSNLLFGGRVIY